MNNKIHIVFGPTASGKTEYSVQLAQKFDSVIINGDSMQIYKEIPIITNQPTIDERKGIPHLLFGYKHILENSNMNDWLEKIVHVIRETQKVGKVPIVAGGTGMYLKALIDGVSEIPEIGEEVRTEVREQMDKLGAEKMYAILKEKDPQAAEKLKPGDSQRISRALEVVEYTGISITEWNKKSNKIFFKKEDFEIHFLDVPREEVYDKINRRFEKFVELGAVFEAKKAKEIFENSDFTQEELNRLPAYKAHGLRELMSFIDGKITIDEAIAKGQQVTRNYAKRQMTWWRNSMQEKNTMRIILASTSPIRKEMLSQAGIVFEAVSPDCDESAVKRQNPNVNLSDMALVLAKAKAASISGPDTYVIGSDQICEFEGKSISKSKNEQDAFDCLKKLQGKTHTQNNGTCVYFNGECVYEFKDKATLKMKALNDEEIRNYIKKDHPIGCAGSYKFELNGKYLFEKIEGNEECIQGFGLSKVVDFLGKVAK